MTGFEPRKRIGGPHDTSYQNHPFASVWSRVPQIEGIRNNPDRLGFGCFVPYIGCSVGQRLESTYSYLVLLGFVIYPCILGIGVLGIGKGV